MVAKRILLGAVLAGVFGASTAAGQTGPAGTAPPLSSPGTGVAPGGPAWLAGPPPAGGPTPGPTATLTAPPGLATAGTLPPGSVAAPWCGATPAGATCCGPVGRNGPVTYELYTQTGPNLIVGGSSVLTGALKTGWSVGGGGRTLFFNTDQDAAWAIDLGLMYTYNGAYEGWVLDVYSRTKGVTANQAPDQLLQYRPRDFYRTAFTYAVGRDWWLNGPATTGTEAGFNSRVGVDVGGRWGTEHINLIPATDPSQYLRRQSVFNSVVVGAHYTWEKPLGAWVLFGGLKAQWAMNYSHVIPPQDSRLQDVNILGTIGIRY